MSKKDLDVQQIRWLDGDYQVRNQILAGTVNFGDEVILTKPGGWMLAGAELNSAVMLGIVSDLTADVSGGASCITVVGHRYPAEQGWTQSPLVYGMQPKGNPGDPASLRIAIYYDRIGFAPEGSAQHPNCLDSFVQRVETNGQPDLKFSAGEKYVLLSELSKLLGR